jgi:hypothetical protein
MAKGLSSVNKMRIEKIVLEKSAYSLLEKSVDCFDQAKSQQDLADKTRELSAEQHKNADLQHKLAVEQAKEADKLEANAKKVETMGRSLEASAIETMGDTTVVQRG